MKVGITFGSFEYCHIGHIKLFENAKKKCDKLIVCVSTDEYIKFTKKHNPEFTLEERKHAISSIKYVDIVDIQSLEFTKKQAILKYKPDIIFVGNDWNKKTYNGEGLGVKVIYLQRTRNISSTKLRGEKNVW